MLTVGVGFPRRGWGTSALHARAVSLHAVTLWAGDATIALGLMINLLPARKPFLARPSPQFPLLGAGACCRMVADNSTGDPHAPRPQLSVTDIIVVTVYFALNVAVGIWVRSPRWGASQDGHWGVGAGRLGAHLEPAGALLPALGWICRRP